MGMEEAQASVPTITQPRAEWADKETALHINLVRRFMLSCIGELSSRAIEHDRSKIESPEREGYELVTERLRGLKYGSPEYEENLKDPALKEALAHHYRCNTHHAEHYPEGMAGMDLFDIMEMLCDWKAAGLRHDTGNILESIDHNAKRWGIPPMLVAILKNTVDRMDWGPHNRPKV